MRRQVVLLALAALLSRAEAGQADDRYRGWPAYGGGAEQIRYSALRQIDRTNVKQLRVAWTYDSGEEGGLQSNPVVEGGVPGRHELDGTQELNWGAVAKAIADTGFSGYLAHEFVPTRDPLTSLREAVALCDA